MEQKFTSYDDAAKEALKSLESATPPAVEDEKAVQEEVKETKEVAPEKEATPSSETPQEKQEGLPPEKLIEELNKLGFKVKGKEKRISSLDELRRIINLGFNYEENARKLNEEREKLKQLQQVPRQQNESAADYDERQALIEQKLQMIEQYFTKMETERAEKEVNEAINSFKSEVPDITDAEIDAITLELQNRLDLLPPDAEVDLKTLMRQIYLEMNPDYLDRLIQKRVQEELDKMKKEKAKSITTEGGTTPPTKGSAKIPTSYEEALRMALEDPDLFKK